MHSIPSFSQVTGINVVSHTDTPLNNCTIKEKCTLVRFLWAKEVRPMEIYCQILVQYGTRTMNQQRMYELVEQV